MQEMKKRMQQMQQNRRAHTMLRELIDVAWRQDLLSNPDFGVDLVTDWSTRRTRSNCYPLKFRKPRISLAMHRITKPAGAMVAEMRRLRDQGTPLKAGWRRRSRQILQAECNIIIEYESYATDPEIGDFLSDDWQDHLALTMAHELAHAIQYCEPRFKGRSRNHDRTFQDIYRVLRRHYVNCRAWSIETPRQAIAASAPDRPLLARDIRTVGLPLFD